MVITVVNYNRSQSVQSVKMMDGLQIFPSLLKNDGKFSVKATSDIYIYMYICMYICVCVFTTSQKFFNSKIFVF